MDHTSGRFEPVPLIMTDGAVVIGIDHIENLGIPIGKIGVEFRWRRPSVRGLQWMGHRCNDDDIAVYIQHLGRESVHDYSQGGNQRIGFAL